MQYREVHDRLSVQHAWHITVWQLIYALNIAVTKYRNIFLYKKYHPMVSYDLKCIFLIDYLWKGHAINGEYYVKLLKKFSYERLSPPPPMKSDRIYLLSTEQVLGFNGCRTWLWRWIGWSPYLFSWFGPIYHRFTSSNTHFAGNCSDNKVISTVDDIFSHHMKACSPQGSKHSNKHGRIVLSARETTLKNKAYSITFCESILVNLGYFQTSFVGVCLRSMTCATGVSLEIDNHNLLRRFTELKPEFQFPLASLDSLMRKYSRQMHESTSSCMQSSNPAWKYPWLGTSIIVIIMSYLLLIMKASSPVGSKNCSNEWSSVWTANGAMLKNKPHLDPFLVGLWTFQPTPILEEESLLCWFLGSWFESLLN